MGTCSAINSAWRCRGEGGKGCHAKRSDWMHVLFSLCVFLLCTSRYFGNRKPSSKAQKQGKRSMQHLSLWAFHRLSVSHSKMPVLTSAKSTQGHKRFWLDPIAPRKVQPGRLTIRTQDPHSGMMVYTQTAQGPLDNRCEKLDPSTKRDKQMRI